MTNEEAALDAFFEDSRVSELCELLRTCDDVLDVISLTENQHSDILAWLLDPREGHGQGDQILRDLLLAAATRAPSVRLDGRQRTGRFFAKWPPSRIRTASFGAAFVARELGMQARERVDLFVIDPQNEFVLVIENKAGIKHTSKQLEGYKKNFESLVNSKSRVQGFDCAFIALDRNFDDLDDEEELPEAGSWLHLGYEWLAVSANRALMQVERGNIAARLVVSYCNRQTNWESPQEKRASIVAASLHHDHGEAIKYLLDRTLRRIEVDWLENDKANRRGLLYMLQNRSLERVLRETRGLASVANRIVNEVHGLTYDHVDWGKVRLWVCPSGWDRFGKDNRWPVSMLVTYNESDRSKFKIALVWNSKCARDENECAALRQRLAVTYRAFATHNNSSRRVAPIDSGLTLDELLNRISGLNVELASLLRSVSAN